MNKLKLRRQLAELAETINQFDPAELAEKDPKWFIAMYLLITGMHGFSFFIKRQGGGLEGLRENIDSFKCAAALNEHVAELIKEELDKWEN